MADRILVTGASGCIGRFVVPLLAARGWDVHGVMSRDRANLPPAATWHRANLLEPGDTDRIIDDVRPTHLLHLAWTVTPGRWATAPDNVAWLESSLYLARRFRASGGARFVGVGSCLEYDWEIGYCREATTPRTPATLYGACKNALYEVLSRSGGEDFSFAWARVFFLYGPYEHPDRLVAAVIRALLSGEPARTSHGRQVRDYLYVADVAEALVTLVMSKVTGAYNVSSGRPVELRDIVTRIGRAIGRPDLIQLGAIPEAATDRRLVVGDPSKFEADLGWAPKIDLDSGLAATIDWWRGQLTARGGERPQP